MRVSFLVREAPVLALADELVKIRITGGTSAEEPAPKAATRTGDVRATRGSFRRWSARAAALLLVAPIVIVVDRCIGFVFPALGSALVSSAGSAARYQALEFDITAHNNALGLRGGELGIERRPGVKRVVAIGDSFTWGWGVPDGASWPADLEHLLGERGLRTEVANAGQPGAYPTLYAENARRVIPVLKPDLVVVGVLQGDDVEQLRSGYSPIPASVRFTKALRRILPSLAGLAKRLQNSLSPIADIGVAWRGQARSILDALSETERRRYTSLDGEVRTAFEDGRLNPFLVNIALHHPDYFLDATRHEGLAEPQAVMAEGLRGVADVARENGCDVLVVAIPYPVYVSRAGLETQRKLGFELDESLLSSDVPDRTIQEACDRALVPCVNFTAAFRERCVHEQLYFPIDGHLDERGHRFLAEQLLRPVEERLRKER